MHYIRFGFHQNFMSWLSYPTRFAGRNFTLLWTHMDRQIPTLLFASYHTVHVLQELDGQQHFFILLRRYKWHVSWPLSTLRLRVHKLSIYSSVRDCLSFCVLTESVGDNLACHDANRIRDGQGTKYHPHPILIEMPQGHVCLTRQTRADCQTEGNVAFIAHLQTMNSVANLVLRRWVCEFLCCWQFNFARL